MKRILAILVRLLQRKPKRPQTTDEQMADLKRALDRLLDEETGNG
ncbi:hypothetical protein [Neoaquamicrobium sediminum]